MKISGYHAHVYFDAATKERALALRDAIAERFAIEMGRVHDRAVGPHPLPMYQVAFDTDEFAKIVPWLMLNRDGLTILLHPGTGDAYADHTRHAAWMGEVLPLKLEVLRRGGA